MTCVPDVVTVVSVVCPNPDCQVTPPFTYLTVATITGGKAKIYIEFFFRQWGLHKKRPHIYISGYIFSRGPRVIMTPSFAKDGLRSISSLLLTARGRSCFSGNFFPKKSDELRVRKGASIPIRCRGSHLPHLGQSPVGLLYTYTSTLQAFSKIFTEAVPY
jgi:hypothetical protein